jgi:hypothetical protein
VKPDALVYGYSGPGVTVDSLLRPGDPSGRTDKDPDEGNTNLDGRSVWLADDHQAMTVWDLRGTRLFVRNEDRPGRPRPVCAVLGPNGVLLVFVPLCTARCARPRG